MTEDSAASSAHGVASGGASARPVAAVGRPARRALLVAAAGAAGVAGFGLLPRALQAQGSFPSRPITLWVPWPAGGATDLSLRLLAELAGRHLGERIVVENRGGAAGTLVMPVLQQAEPDGYTIAQLPQPVFRAPFLQRVLWDPVRDTTPILQVSGVTFGLIVAADSPLRSVADLFALARAKPGQVSIATNGVGSSGHLVLEELFAARGLSFIHVPYKGTAEQLLAVGSQVVMAGVNASGYGPAVEAGKLRVLATFGAHRAKRWPQVPTLRELGYDAVAQSPWGLAGPRGLPPAIVQTLHDAFRKAMLEPAFIHDLAKYDQELDYLGPDDYAKAVRQQVAKERAHVERLGLMRQPG